MSQLEQLCQEIGEIALVTSLFKMGNRNEPGNYRAVSLICILCKFFIKKFKKSFRSPDEISNIKRWSAFKDGHI